VARYFFPLEKWGRFGFWDFGVLIRWISFISYWNPNIWLIQQVYPFSIPKVLLCMLFSSVTKFNKSHISLFPKRHRPISNQITLFLHTYWYVLYRKGTVDLSPVFGAKIGYYLALAHHFQKMLLVLVTVFWIINLLSFLDALCHFWSVVLLSLSNASSPASKLLSNTISGVNWAPCRIPQVPLQSKIKEFLKS
jgi:hypothetical protein